MSRMQPLTDRQRQTLDWIKAHRRRFGVPPTRSELARGLELRGASSIDVHLKALTRKGWIELEPNMQRGIRLLDEEDLPLVGPVAEVAAGQPIPAEPHVVDRIPAEVAERFSPRPDYFLTVRGDSMDLTGLRDGDIVAIRSNPDPNSGEMVVGRVDDEVTLKRFVRLGSKHVELRPESSNPEHKPVRIDLARERLHIDGIVVGALIGKR